jgi:hypothetical protein
MHPVNGAWNILFPTGFGASCQAEPPCVSKGSIICLIVGVTPLTNDVQVGSFMVCSGSSIIHANGYPLSVQSTES